MSTDIHQKTTQELNQDPQEIAKFNQLAQAWWDPKGPLWTLHAINPIRSQFIDSHVNVAELDCLDVGCGAGLLTEALAYRGAKAKGLDLSPDLIQIAKDHAVSENFQSKGLSIEYFEQSIEALSDTNKISFDVITCMEMLEHVPDPNLIVQAIGKLLKPGGWVFFSTLHRKPKAFLQAIIAAEYLLKIVPQGTHSYEKFIKPSELAKYCRAAGLDLIQSKGIQYNPITKHFSTCKIPDVNYMLAVQKPL